MVVCCFDRYCSNLNVSNQNVHVPVTFGKGVE
jgi:hypothetical protein